MKINLALLACVLLGACQSGPPPRATQNSIEAELKAATENRKVAPAQPAAVAAALLPPLSAGLPVPTPIAPAKVAEQRFSLSVHDEPAKSVFNALVADTRYSMLVHPDVSGNVTLNLKDVTLEEMLEAIRDLYGYEYRIQGTRIYIQPVTMQSRVFKVNYLTTLRNGRSETRVSSGNIVGSSGSAGSSGSGASATPATGGAASSAGSNVLSNGSQISTSSKSDFWTELADTIKIIIGNEGGRTVVVSPQSGIVVVRALPRELREVEQYLQSARVTIEKQVMLEAKIIEVTLNDGFQAGINWGAFTGNRDHRFSSGASASRLNQPGSLYPGSNTGSLVGNDTTPPTLADLLSTPLSGVAGRIPASPLGGALGLAVQTNSFSALLSFLDTQGSVQVLSSPRIATLNNQKAVLKVGTDDFYVTNISTTTTSTGNNSVSSPSITVQPFFSGISLDVTPQIDDDGNIILHVRPSVSVVSEKMKTINLGSMGVYNLPLASANTNETDSIVRVRDGNVVAIGGLMEQAQTDDTAKVPIAGDVPVAGTLFKQSKRAMQKRELVVLLKPTIISGDKQWEDDLNQTRARLQTYGQRLDANPQ